MMEQKCSNCGNGKWRDGVTAITDTCTKCHYVDKGALCVQPSNWKPMSQTNADRIRAMSDEQLAKLFMDFAVKCYDDCGVSAEIITTDYVMQWLQQPAEVKDNG